MYMYIVDNPHPR